MSGNVRFLMYFTEGRMKICYRSLWAEFAAIYFYRYYTKCIVDIMTEICAFLSMITYFILTIQSIRRRL